MKNIYFSFPLSFLLGVLLAFLPNAKGYSQSEFVGEIEKSDLWNRQIGQIYLTENTLWGFIAPNVKKIASIIVEEKFDFSNFWNKLYTKEQEDLIHSLRVFHLKAQGLTPELVNIISLLTKIEYLYVETAASTPHLSQLYNKFIHHKYHCQMDGLQTWVVCEKYEN